MAKYEIKDAKTANLDEIYFDKNVGKMCYKNAYGIITELEAAPPAPGLETNPTTNFLPSNWLGEFADSPINLSIAPAGYLGWAKLSTRIGTLLSVPTGVDQTNVAPYLPQYGLSITNNPVQGSMTTIGDTGSGTLRLSVINNYPPNSALANSLYAQGGGAGFNSSFWVKGDGSLVQIGQQLSFNTTNIMNGIFADRATATLKINCGITSPNDGIISVSGTTGLILLNSLANGAIGLDIFGNNFIIGSPITTFIPPNDPVNPQKWVKVSDGEGNFYNMPLYQ